MRPVNGLPPPAASSIRPSGPPVSILPSSAASRFRPHRPHVSIIVSSADTVLHPAVAPRTGTPPEVGLEKPATIAPAVPGPQAQAPADIANSRRDALSDICFVADPLGAVTLDARLLKMTKSAILVNCDDIHDPRRHVADLFPRLQDRLTLGVSGLTAFKIILTEIVDYFDHAPCRPSRVIIARTVKKGGHLTS